MAIKAFIFASNSGMNISGVMMLLVIVAIVLIWILLKPKKTERRRFNLRERRLDREAEKDDKED